MKINYSKGIITPEEAIKHLSLTGQSNSIYEEIIKIKEAAKKARELNIVVSDEQAQGFADNFRNTRGLRSAEEMFSFLRDSGLTVHDFEEFCESSVLASRLRDQLVDEKKIEEYFINKRSEFDKARISIIVIMEENLAKEIVMQVTEDDEDFHSLARKYSLDEATRDFGGYVGLVSRNSLLPQTAANVFGAAPGDLLGPYKKSDKFQLILVEEVLKAELNDDIKNLIRERIFQEWISNFLKGGIKITL